MFDIIDTETLYPTNDLDWTEKDWDSLLQSLIDDGILTMRDICSLVLGHLNPPQVGTSLASNVNFQARYAPRKTWAAVRSWYFEQTGRCADCGSRMELQADHIRSRELHGAAADRLDNMIMRCRRCNVIRRPSHKNGGLTHQTTESALMWILFVKRPQTYQAYQLLCRTYGLTMANIRFQEAWAMARWLHREKKYHIDDSSNY